MGDYERVLYPSEVESYLESLQVFDISEIGSNRWFEQSKRIYKLSLQASVDARSGSDEIVKEETVIYQKVPVLVHELIAVELWRLKVLPHLLKMESVTKSVIPLYTVLYHEVTLLSFLEIVLFHEDVMESAGDTLVDLIDYCYRSIVILKGINPKELTDDPSANLEGMQRIQDLKKKINFESGLKCVTILSCIVQHKKTVSLSVLHRILVIHDMPLLFTELVCDPPWVREDAGSGQTEKFLDGQWKKVSPGELLKLSKIEGQLWISLLLLLLDPECQRKYDMNGFRKDQILKLRSKINEVVMDQIPELKEMARWLEHLNLFDPSRPKSELIMEQIPEIWENLRQSNRGKWSNIAQNQGLRIFTMSPSQLQQFCTKMGESFDVKNIEAMLPDRPVCAHCKEREGKKRCSRCTSEWYCGRPCQVSHWTKHKPACDLMASKNENSKTPSSSK